MSNCAMCLFLLNSQFIFNQAHGVGAKRLDAHLHLDKLELIKRKHASFLYLITMHHAKMPGIRYGILVVPTP